MQKSRSQGESVNPAANTLLASFTATADGTYRLSVSMSSDGSAAIEVSGPSGTFGDTVLVYLNQQTLKLDFGLVDMLSTETFVVRTETSGTGRFFANVYAELAHQF